MDSLRGHTLGSDLCCPTCRKCDFEQEGISPTGSRAHDVSKCSSVFSQDPDGALSVDDCYPSCMFQTQLSPWSPRHCLRAHWVKSQDIGSVLFPLLSSPLSSLSSLLFSLSSLLSFSFFGLKNHSGFFEIFFPEDLKCQSFFWKMSAKQK